MITSDSGKVEETKNMKTGFLPRSTHLWEAGTCHSFKLDPALCACIYVSHLKISRVTLLLKTRYLSSLLFMYSCGHTRFTDSIIKNGAKDRQRYWEKSRSRLSINIAKLCEWCTVPVVISTAGIAWPVNTRAGEPLAQLFQNSRVLLNLKYEQEAIY